MLGMGLGMALISWGTPASADTGPGDAGAWFSSQTQPTHRVAAEAAEVVGAAEKAVVPGSATAAVPARAKGKAMVPKMEPVPKSVPGMVRGMARDLVMVIGMFQAKDPAVAPEKSTVSGLQDGPLIGVGKSLSALPSLRTVHAVLPHTALQSIVSSSGSARC